MKKILVPTDYSTTATNALDYAVELAKSINGEIVLLHVFNIPVLVSDMPIVIDSFDIQEELEEKQLEKYKNDTIAKYGKSVPISGILRSGFINDEIKEVTKEKNIDLIVMGMTGVSKMAELFIGSNASRIIKTIDCPTITVHENTKYQPIKRIAFACDYEDVEESPALEKLIELVQLFEAKLLLINIIDPEAKPTHKKTLSVSLLEHIFEQVYHTVSFRKNDDPVEGINRFVDHHRIDMVIMFPKKHSLFHSLFHERNTKKMAFHAHVPLLTINSRNMSKH